MAYPPRARSDGERVGKLRSERSCGEFPGRRPSHFVIPVVSDPTMDLARGSESCL